MAIKKFQFLDESGVDTLLSEVKSKTDILYAPKEGTETTKGAQDKANKALADANKYTDEKISEIPTPDVSGQISTHNTDEAAHNDIRLLLNNKADIITDFELTVNDRSQIGYTNETTDLVIPETFRGTDNKLYRITSIGDAAFQNCTNLTSVTIPDSVTSIGNAVFQNCTNLTSVTIPNSVTSIGNAAFYGCTSLTSITIPNSVSIINTMTFYNCTSLTTVTIPNIVSRIGDASFAYCTSLTSITIPNSVTSIGNAAFQNCANLTSVTIPNSVTSIGGGTFSACNKLSTVYYEGTEEDWNKISINGGNNYLTDANILYSYNGSDIPTKVSELTNDSGYLTSETDPTVPTWAKQPNKPTYTAAEVGLGNVDNVKQYSVSNPPPYPVTSVNGKTGAVTLSASDVGADPKDTASNLISGHNTNTSAHSDIRLLIDGLTSRLNALANSTDEDLDQMAEVVAYIKNNKSLIDGITTSKVNVSDIINNLTTNVSDQPLSAAQGVELKALIDAIVIPTKISDLTNDTGFVTGTDIPTNLSELSEDATHRLVTDSEKSTWNNKADVSDIPTKVSELTNDSGFLTGYTETDPTVPAWAKAASKPTYTAAEVGADPKNTASSLVSSHNTNTSAHEDIRKAISDHTSNSGIHVTTADKTNWNNKVDADYVDDKLDNYLPLSGGTLTGRNLFSGNGLGRWYSSADNTSISHLNEPNNIDNARGFMVYNSNMRPELSNALAAYDCKDGIYEIYRMFGEHNKPSGTYTGNGSIATRVIDTMGIGNACVIYNKSAVTIVTPVGGFCLDNDKTTLTYFKPTELSFINGVLTINTDSQLVNYATAVFKYQIL